ncbi:hypothetical protein CHARACLAT_020621 [Characodon lateralis]|uniref:Uncharacterized protein n=1 Tax=Characodon lateralis TaxID=208331 RepID=A0ABU7EWF0_9TELE|nr:hypothetical protein [Characodon lateralis]
MVLFEAKTYFPLTYRLADKTHVTVMDQVGYFSELQGSFLNKETIFPQVPLRTYRLLFQTYRLHVNDIQLQTVDNRKLDELGFNTFFKVSFGSFGYMNEPYIHHNTHTLIWSLVFSSVSTPGQSFHATFPPVVPASVTNPSFLTPVHAPQTHTYSHLLKQHMSSHRLKSRGASARWSVGAAHWVSSQRASQLDSIPLQSIQGPTRLTHLLV